MASSTFRYPHRVTYADCTIGNHIYYARYLNLLEAARGEFLRHVGKPFLELQTAGVIFPVIECRLRYRGAARYDDLLTIELWLTELARVRLTFEYRVLGPDGRELVDATTMNACTNVDDKPRRLPEDLTAALGPYTHRAGD
jgi:acyl-CoA thioester hydrolase